MPSQNAISDLSGLSIMEASPQCVKIISEDGIIAYINRTGLDFLEAEDSTRIVGNLVYDLIDKEHRDLWKRNHLSVCKGESKTWEYEIVGLKGTRRYLETYATPLKFPDGTSLQFAVTKDITDKKRLELAAHELESNIRAMTEATLSISGSGDIRKLLSVITDRAREIIGANIAVTSLLPDDGFTESISAFSCSDSYHSHQNYQVTPEVLGMNFLVSLADKTFRLNGQELTNDPYWKNWEGRKELKPELESWLAVPFKGKNGHNIGVVQLFNKVAGEFSLTDEIFLTQYVQYAALAIERQLSMEKLRDSEERFRVLVNTIQNLVWMADGAGAVYWYNSRWTEYTGLTIEDMQGWGWQKVHHPDYVEQVTTFMKTAWKENKPFEVIHPLKDKNGVFKWFIYRGTPICDNYGNITQWMGTLTDIDEQKRGEETFRAISDDAPLWIWLSDKDGKVDFANKAMLSFLGCDSFSRITPETWTSFVYPDDLPMVQRTVGEAYQTRKSYYMECRIRNMQSGEYEWFAFRTVVRSIEQSFAGFIGTGSSIQGQKSSVENLEEMVAERTKEAYEINEALQRSNEELARFAHTASHDLKAPVRKVRIFAEALRLELEQAGSQGSKRYLDKIEETSRRMSDLIDGILNYSSISGENQPVRKVDLNAVLNDVESDLEVLIDEKKAVIMKKNAMPQIEGMPTLLHQLFSNVISNALKFTMPEVSPVIRISANPMSAREIKERDLNTNKVYWIICIEDNGIGFDQSDADKIFQTYLRLNSRDAYEGTGLGLALCKRIVQRHGGLIEAEGVLKKGALIRIVLPEF